MYLSQQIEAVKGTGGKQGYTGFRLTRYRVELDASGRPVWKFHGAAGTWWAYSAYIYERNNANKKAKAWGRQSDAGAIPFMSDAAPNKPVTMKQAETLTGLLVPAALDKLTETVSDSPVLQNYVKPKPVKEPKPEPVPVAPTPADVNQSKLTKARAKVAEWESRIRHANEKLREWRKAVKCRERRAHMLGAATTSSS